MLPQTCSVHLKEIELFGYHGLFPQEKKIGAWFQVNVDLAYVVKAPISSLDQTIDYSAVYAIIKQSFQQPTDLLETLAQRGIHQLLSAYPMLDYIKITILKKNPPIAQLNGKIGISMVHQKDNQLW